MLFLKKSSLRLGTEVFLVLLILFSFIGCNQNNAQLEFEQKAYTTLPENFTRTTSQGDLDEDHIDINDWRVSPFYEGLVLAIDPIYPNPVLTNDRLTLQISLVGINDIQRIMIYSMNENYTQPKFVTEYPSPILSFVTISISPQDIIFETTSPQGLYRIIVEDERRNVITYGDVQIN